MRMLYLYSFLFLFLPFTFAQDKNEYIRLNPGSDLPFSDAVRAGNTLYLSGKIAFDPSTGKVVEGGIEAETRAVLTNIKDLLEKLGSSMDDVVKCTVILADINEWQAMNNVYKTFFKNFPARTSFAASGLALNARVEIECIAVIND